MSSFSVFKKKFTFYFLKNVLHLRLPADIIWFGLRRYDEKYLFELVGKNQKISYKQFNVLINNLINKIETYNLPEKCVIAYLNGNPVTYYAIRSVCHIKGYVFFAIPPGLSDETVLHFLKETGTKAICFEDIQSDTLHLYYQQLTDVIHIKMASEIPEPKAAINSRKKFSKPEPADTATLNLSSGTTGKTPKIIELSHQNWTSSVFNYILNTHSGGGKDIRFLCTLPCATAGSTSFLLTFLAGMTQIIVPADLTTSDLAEAILKHRVTSLFITPTHFYRFYYHSLEHQIKYPSLNQIIIGTEVASPWIIAGAISYFGPIIHISYGMVEVLPPLTMLAPSDYFHGNVVDTEKLKTVGKVLKGVTVMLSNSNGEAFSTPGKTGLVQINGPTVSRGYRNNPGGTDTSFNQGWFHSNDFGQFDNHGLLSIFGRKDDIVLELSNRQIFASELENCIYETGIVRYCAVTGYQTRIGVLVVPENRNHLKLEDKISQKIHQYIGEPVLTDILKYEDIPVTALGKLNRLKCKELIYG